ncbi:hypothetical protein ACF3NT_10510 [Naumannella halotolerans]|uniref:hypothetical protein n=1 Tax=Naumannella halotolerans TaxID=993414 RepID=UPI00370D4BF4
MRDTYPVRLFGSLGLIIVGAALASILAANLTGVASQVLLVSGLVIAGLGVALLIFTMIRPRHPDPDSVDHG